MLCCRRIRCGIHRSSTLEVTGVNSGVFRGDMLKAFALPHQRPFQDDTALLVSLALLRGKLVHPAEFAVAVLAADVSHHMSSCQHDSVLHFAVLKIHNLVEQESSTGGSSEACWNKFCPVSQNGVTVGTGEEASSTNVVQEDPPHFVCSKRQKAKKEQSVYPPRRDDSTQSISVFFLAI